MSKKKVFLIHLAASLFVFSIILMLIIYLWYPAPYFDTDYRMKWILMIAFVDIVIGPGLTLFIYRADKPNIRFDMAVIVILQVTALSWGVWNAWSAHPLTNVFFDGQVYCLDRKEVKASGVDRHIVANSMTDKIMLLLPYPESREMKKKYLRQNLKDKPMVFSLGHFYEVASKEMTSELDENQPDIVPIISGNEKNMKQWQEFISKYEKVNTDWRYYRFRCFKDEQVAVLDRKNNKIEAILKMRLPDFWGL